MKLLPTVLVLALSQAVSASNVRLSTGGCGSPSRLVNRCGFSVVQPPAGQFYRSANVDYTGQTVTLYAADNCSLTLASNIGNDRCVNFQPFREICVRIDC